MTGTMVFTPLHRALGREPSALTYQMIEAAVAQQVRESGALDWKGVLPTKEDSEPDIKFAKDVAAMANSGGGMIVFGVAEVRETSAAREIVPVEGWTEAVELKLRGWAWALIQPSVPRLQFIPLESDDGSLVIVLEIPPSFETPHFLMKNDSIRAPKRYGSRTVYMTERDIEQAYRARFEDRRSHDRTLSELLDEVLDGVDRYDHVWLAAAARPISPRPTYAGRITMDEARAILADLVVRNPFLKGANGLYSAELLPSVGYRKWRSANQECVVEIHDDGSVALAYNSAFEMDEFDPSTDVHVMEAKQLPAHIVHLARTAAEKLGLLSEFEARITIESSGPGPIYIRTFGDAWRDHMIPREQLMPIHHFHPVGAVFPGTGEDPADQLRVVRSLALDIMNQAGHTDVGEEHLQNATE
ncbi:UNVERIFIED_CONTAM: hypothetical protein ABIE34_001680 [Jeotgalibacillus campisalis]